MDMRSLNSTLPSSAAKKTPSHPPENLLQAFKSAALSVTTLYKAAAAEQAAAHSDGYQAALDDLLGFLDRENIGLGDGEGWRIRQWATERHQGTSHAFANGSTESEDDDGEESKTKRQPRERDMTQSTPPPQPPITSSIAPAEPISSVDETVVPQQADFTFRSPYIFHPNHDIEVNPPDQTRVRVEVHPRRPSRTSTRSTSPRLTRSTANVFGPGAGTKRKASTIDFFGFNNDHMDGPGGGKRGRMI